MLVSSTTPSDLSTRLRKAKTERKKGMDSYNKIFKKNI